MQRFAPDVTAERVAVALRDDGVCVVEDLAPPGLLDTIEAEVRPWIDRTPAGGDEFSGKLTRRTGALIARSPGVRDLILHPLVLAAAKDFLPYHTALQLHLTQTIAIGPGESGQTIHRDQWAWDFFDFPKGYDVQCNTIWALTDFTEANGGTRVIPGSNQWEDKLRIDYADTEAVEMSRGSVVMYSGSVYHGGGANQTEHERVGLNLTYCLGWLRQEENQYLACPPEIARTLPKDLQRLMGYARGAYALGYVDDLRDPLDALMAVESSVSSGAGSFGVLPSETGVRS